MAKIQLGKRPTSFPKLVTFPMLDGTTGEIEIMYRYRTLHEYGLFVDEANKEDKVQPSESVKAKKFSMAATLKKTMAENAAYLMKIAIGWNLESEFNDQSALQLADEQPNAIIAIVNSYREAILEGRLGN